MEDGMTSPAAGMQPGMGPAGQEAPMSDAETTAGYEICIRVDGQGKLAVGVESNAQEAAEANGQMEPSAEYTPVESIKEALTMALDIYRADGQMAGDGGQDSAEFEAGFKSR